MKTHHLIVVSALVVVAFVGVPAARAQSAADPSGHWKGSLEIPGQSLPIEFDLAKDAKGQLMGTVTGTGVTNLPLTKVAVSGRTVTLQATTEQPFNGELSDDGRTMSGTVAVSGYAVPLVLSRSGDARIEPTPTSPPITKELEGTWEGTLEAGRGPLRLALTMTNEPNGRALAHIVSLDEGGLLLPVVITQNGPNVSYTSTAVPTSWTGVLSPDGRELTGTFTQGPSSLPLTFRRAAK